MEQTREDIKLMNRVLKSPLGKERKQRVKRKFELQSILSEDDAISAPILYHRERR